MARQGCLSFIMITTDNRLAFIGAIESLRGYFPLFLHFPKKYQVISLIINEIAIMDHNSVFVYPKSLFSFQIKANS